MARPPNPRASNPPRPPSPHSHPVPPRSKRKSTPRPPNKQPPRSAASPGSAGDFYIVTQVNLQHCKVAWDTLVVNLCNINNPVFLVTEPYHYTNNKLPKVNKDLVPFYYSKGDINPRAAILIHKNLVDECSELTQFTTRDLVAVTLKFNGEEKILVSSYMDIKKDISPNDLTAVVDFAKKRGSPLIGGSDTNSRHTKWGDRVTNTRGK